MSFLAPPLELVLSRAFPNEIKSFDGCSHFHWCRSGQQQHARVGGAQFDHTGSLARLRRLRGGLDVTQRDLDVPPFVHGLEHKCCGVQLEAHGAWSVVSIVQRQTHAPA